MHALLTQARPTMMPFLSDAFTNPAQFHVRENCTHLFSSQTVKLVSYYSVSDTSREGRGNYSKNNLPPESIIIVGLDKVYSAYVPGSWVFV